MIANQKILIVEDEEKIARVIKLELEFEGYEVDAAYDGLTGLEKIRSDTWDLVLLDIMLPELNGLEVLRRIRTKDENTPVILLTARDSVPEKVAGLDQGANDYITKPFQIEELLARVRASLRLKGISNKTEDIEKGLILGNLVVNEKTREVKRGDREIELTPREFDLLVYFLQNKQLVLNRDQILSAVWGFDYYGDTNVVDVYIRYLRRKIDNGEPPLIHTVRGVGYVLKEQ
ncbi:response regulator transcription factor [Pseudalkalibacillus salsuginis]|uniref:response regulator transcription factor n=1 Tax=Pseudalkalibacillus salsuginis TaxID=2910972 RepID=UPI001F20F5C3|nr:response regulator transcription factor [Pseudalkalibacillus salsuginis]MCF6411350.1 response regulator transcription factor [Pseudalkalibacillus salsuginis]